MGEELGEMLLYFVKINKRKPQLNVELGRPGEGALMPYHAHRQLPQTGRLQLLTPTGRVVPCTTKQVMQLLYSHSKRKGDFFLAQQQAPMENAAVQPMRSRTHLNFYFPPMNFHFSPPY